VEAPLPLLVPLLVITTVVCMSTNGLAFTATGELARADRAGVAMGFQNTWLFISGALAPIAFGAVVSALTWGAGFALVCVLAVPIAVRVAVDVSRRAWERLDGHTLRGSYSFAVGTGANPGTTLADSPLDSEGPLGLVGRFVELIALGTWLAWALLRRPSRRAGLDPSTRRRDRRSSRGPSVTGRAPYIHTCC